MMQEERAAKIEEAYGMPPGRLMYHFYHEENMSQYEIAEEMDEPRETVRYWLQRSGVKMRDRTLTDVQKLMIMTYLSAGLGTGSAAKKANCGKTSVIRYRDELQAAKKPVDVDLDLSTGDWDVLCQIIEEDIVTESSSSESTSNCAVESD